MSTGGHPRFRPALAGLVLAGLALAAWPAGAEEGKGAWTDPPARGAPAGTQTPAAATPAPEAARPAPPARAERPPARQEARDATRAEKPARRSARVRRERIREAAQPPRVERRAEAPVQPRHPARRLAARAAPGPSMLRERRAARTRFRGPVYGYAEPEFPGYGRAAGPPDGDWEPLMDARAERIARARAAGFLVMRSRAYAYPDGTVVRRLMPLDGYEPD